MDSKDSSAFRTDQHHPKLLKYKSALGSYSKVVKGSEFGVPEDCTFARSIRPPK